MTIAGKPVQPAMKSAVAGRGEPLVLVPGGLTGWLSWKPYVDSLAADHRVIRVQLLSVELGLNEEPLPPGYGLETESLALANTLDALDVHDVDIVGWSYGAAIALDFALNHPHRVRSLTLIEPPAIWVLQGRLDEATRTFERTVRSYGPGNITDAQLEQFLIDAGIVPPGNEPKEHPQWPVWLEHRQSLRMGDAPFRHEDDLERVRRFDEPVLLFKGEGSPDYYGEIVDILGQALPRARVEQLPGAHVLHIVSKDSFMAILTRFLESVPRGAAPERFS